MSGYLDGAASGPKPRAGSAGPNPMSWRGAMRTFVMIVASAAALGGCVLQDAEEEDEVGESSMALSVSTSIPSSSGNVRGGGASAPVAGGPVNLPTTDPGATVSHDPEPCPWKPGNAPEPQQKQNH